MCQFFNYFIFIDWSFEALVWLGTTYQLVTAAVCTSTRNEIADYCLLTFVLIFASCVSEVLYTMGCVFGNFRTKRLL